MSGGQGALSQRLRDPLLSRPKGCLVHVHSFITCLMGTLGSGMVFGLQKITDQEIQSPPTEVESRREDTLRSRQLHVFLYSPPQPQCCFLKIRSKRLTPLLNTLPGPPFTWSKKTQSPYRVRGCWPVEERGGSLAPPHLYVAPARFRALVYMSFPPFF